jgi:hypothetical protein
VKKNFEGHPWEKEFQESLRHLEEAGGIPFPEESKQIAFYFFIEGSRCLAKQLLEKTLTQMNRDELEIN